MQSPGKQFSSVARSKHAKRTLLFDLDETLIHCVDDTSDPSLYQHMVEIKVKSG